jgi:hypothetical protein
LEALHFVNPKTREKTISSIIHKVRAQTTEDVLKEIDNVNLGNQNNIDKGSKTERIVPIGPTDGFGISFLIKVLEVFSTYLRQDFINQTQRTLLSSSNLIEENQ